MHSAVSQTVPLSSIINLPSNNLSCYLYLFQNVFQSTDGMKVPTSICISSSSYLTTKETWYSFFVYIHTSISPSEGLCLLSLGRDTNFVWLFFSSEVIYFRTLSGFLANFQLNYSPQFFSPAWTWVSVMEDSFPSESDHLLFMLLFPHHLFNIIKKHNKINFSTYLDILDLDNLLEFT